MVKIIIALFEALCKLLSVLLLLIFVVGLLSKVFLEFTVLLEISLTLSILLSLISIIVIIFIPKNKTELIKILNVLFISFEVLFKFLSVLLLLIFVVGLLSRILLEYIVRLEISSILSISFLIMLPLIGITLTIIIPGNKIKLIKIISLTFSFITFLISLLLWLKFDVSNPKYQFVECFFFIPYYNIKLFIGVNRITSFFVLLSTFLIPICLLVSWNSIKISFKKNTIAFLFIGLLLICAFTVVVTK